METRTRAAGAVANATAPASMSAGPTDARGRPPKRRRVKQRAAAKAAATTRGGALPDDISDTALTDTLKSCPNGRTGGVMASSANTYKSAVPYWEDFCLHAQWCAKGKLILIDSSGAITCDGTARQFFKWLDTREGMTAATFKN